MQQQQDVGAGRTVRSRRWRLPAAVAALVVTAAAVAVATGAQGASAAPGRAAAQVGRAVAPASGETVTMTARDSASGRFLAGDDGTTFELTGYTWSATARGVRPATRTRTQWAFSVQRPSGAGSTSLVAAFRRVSALDVTLTVGGDGVEGRPGPSTTYLLRECVVSGLEYSGPAGGPQDTVTFDCTGGAQVDVRTLQPNGNLGPVRSEVIPGTGARG